MHNFYDAKQVHNIVDEPYEEAIQAASANWPKEALFYWVKEGAEDIVSILVKQECDLNFSDEEGNTPLMTAIDTEHNSICNIILKAGASVNCSNLKGCSPLMLACKNGMDKLVEKMLKYNADIHFRDNIGHTALYYAIEGGNKDCLEMLLEKGAKLEDSDREGLSPFDYAASFERPDILEWIFKKAGKDVLKNSKFNLLMTAVAWRAYDNIPLLLAYGESMDTKINEQGNTPAMLAHERGLFDILEDWEYIKGIKSKGEKYSVRRTLWKSRFEYLKMHNEQQYLKDDVEMARRAFEEKNYELIHQLAKQGRFPLNSLFHDGRTALEIAVDLELVDMVRLLVSLGYNIPLSRVNKDLFYKLISNKNYRILKFLLEASLVDAIYAVKPKAGFIIRDSKNLICKITQKKININDTSEDVLEIRIGLPVFISAYGDIPNIEKVLQKQLQPYGFYVFQQKNDFGAALREMSFVYCSRFEAILYYYGTCSVYYNITTEDIIEKLRHWREQYGAELIGAGKEWIRLSFEITPFYNEEFRWEVYEFCPQVAMEYDYRYHCCRLSQKELIITWV